MADMDYCQYMISKCAHKCCSTATNGIYGTTKAFLDAYMNSSIYNQSSRAKSQKLLKYIEFSLKEETESLEALEPDVKIVLDHCHRKLDTIETYDDIFTVLSNFLWIMASKRASNRKNFSLTDNDMLEEKHTMNWISEIGKEIENAQYDLHCMEAADNLPVQKQLLLGLLKNQDVAWYANRENISYVNFKQRIQDCRRFLEGKQFLYYAFTATTIYLVDLKWRCR